MPLGGWSGSRPPCDHRQLLLLAVVRGPRNTGADENDGADRQRLHPAPFGG
jgi:hypothetical protein